MRSIYMSIFASAVYAHSVPCRADSPVKKAPESFLFYCRTNFSMLLGAVIKWKEKSLGR